MYLLEFASHGRKLSEIYFLAAQTVRTMEKKRHASDPQWARTESFEHAKDNFPVSYHCLEHDMGIAQAQGVLAQ